MERLKKALFIAYTIILGIFFVFCAIGTISLCFTSEKGGAVFFGVITVILAAVFFKNINKIKISKSSKSKVSDNVDVIVRKETPSYYANKSNYNSEKSENKRPFKGRYLKDKVADYTVIDLETTGTNILRCEIIECSAVKVRNGEIVDTFSQLVKPKKPLKKIISDITGITNEMLEDCPAISDVIESYIDFIGNDIVVGHNIASFDTTIIYDTYLKYCNKHFSNNYIDTLHYSKKCNLDVPDYKLVTIADYLGVKYDAHRALNDCIANQKCYELLKSRFVDKRKNRR